MSSKKKISLVSDEEAGWEDIYQAVEKNFLSEGR
jgi:hypothetical protein